MNEAVKIVYPRERKEDQYESLLAMMKTHFHEFDSSTGLYLYKTEKKDLYQMFLDNLPEYAVQHYTCNACRRFVNKYGGLVTITDDGDVYPVMWPEKGPGIFGDAVAAIRKYLTTEAKVVSVFYSDYRMLGIPQTGEWYHMAVTLDRKFIIKQYPGINAKNCGEKMSASQNDYRSLWNCIEDYSIDVVKEAMKLINSGALFRSDKVKTTCTTFLKLLTNINGETPKVKRNKVWKYIADARDAGCLHIRGGILGTLFDDIKDGVPQDVIVKKFNDKMDPLKYQRPQAAPSTGNIERAEKLFSELGFTNKNLERRFATVDELETIWKPSAVEEAEEEDTSVFGKLKATAKDAPKFTKIEDTISIGSMTWNKFSSDYLPHAKKITVDASKIPTECIATFLTAENPDEKCIFRHGNHFTYYMYSGNFNRAVFSINSAYVEVTAISYDPQVWDKADDSKFDKSTLGVTLILKDAKDLAVIEKYKTGTAVFPEDLIPELHEIRSTIAAFSNVDHVKGGSSASATGLRIQRGVNYGSRVMLIVETDTMGTVSVSIDRWE